MGDFVQQGGPPEIAFGALVHRAVDGAYENLVRLINKPHADKTRQAQALSTFAANTRRTLLQLLVIQKWAPETSVIAKCDLLTKEILDRIAGLDECNDSFWRLHANCYGWRERLYDIRTAVTILSNSEGVLPSDIRNCGQPPSIDAWPKAATFARLHDAIRFRLLDDAPAEQSYSSLQVHHTAHTAHTAHYTRIVLLPTGTVYPIQYAPHYMLQTTYHIPRTNRTPPPSNRWWTDASSEAKLITY
jgi:hypothetical protein